jgi:hypothetical protein
VAVDKTLATTAAPVSARAVAAADTSRRPDQLVHLVPDSAGETGPIRSTGIAL